jgi:hypothetical protein
MNRHMTNESAGAAPHAPIDADELQRRRVSARQMGWWIGAAVFALYLIGFFIKR